MQRDIDALQQAEFDVLVIGGGITGACIGHDAALRGMKVAVVEKRDFGWFTSSASSKLLHGGIRYLPHGQFGKVRESARERNVFQRIAPHLTSWLPFAVPVFKGSFMKSGLAMRCAMLLYNTICMGLAQSDDPGKKLPRTRFLSRAKLLQLVPLVKSLDKMNGGQILYESHMLSSERMTLAFIKTSVSNGAVVANYMEVQSFIQDGDRVTGVHCIDHLTGQPVEIRARVTVNAAGPFIQELNDQQGSIKLARKTTGFSKGVHLVTRQLSESCAIALATPKKTGGIVSRGGRHIFILPWRGKSLIGTTNVSFSGRTEDVKVTSKDVRDFLADINATLPGIDLVMADVDFAFTGLYPLTVDEIRADTYQGTGEYQIIDHQNDGVQGMISALGAKYTTAREIAEQVTDLLVKKLAAQASPCITLLTPLAGGDIKDWSHFIKTTQSKYGPILDEPFFQELVCMYGTECQEIFNLAQHNSLDKQFTKQDVIEAEVEYSVDAEMACTLSDVIFRRTGLGTIGHPGREQLEKVATIMADKLGWDKEEQNRQIQTVDDCYACLRNEENDR